MTTNIGGGQNIIPFPTPTIFEREVSGEKMLRNQGQMGLGVPITKNTDELTIANLTDKDRYYGYRSDQPRPPTPPAGQMRVGGPNVERGAVGWEKHYDNSISHIPPELQAVIAEPEFAALLTVAAKVLNGFEKAEYLDIRENALENAEHNVAFPEKALGAYLNYGGDIIRYAKELLELKGENDPQYLMEQEGLQELETLYNQLKRR